MKKAFFLLAFLFCATMLKAQSRSEWRYEGKINGVSFYTKYLCQDNCSYELFLLKAVNETSTAKEVSTGDIIFKWYTTEIKKLNGAGFTLKPYATKSGQMDGLFWIVPKGHEKEALGYLSNLNVKNLE